MSLLKINFESQFLSGNHQVYIILPDKPRDVTPEAFYRSGEKYRVLWLLHGTFGDQTDWVRKSGIELYAEEKKLAVVMPPALNSNYSNWEDTMLGFRMFDYLTEELMPMVYGWLQGLSPDDSLELAMKAAEITLMDPMTVSPLIGSLTGYINKF